MYSKTQVGLSYPTFVHTTSLNSKATMFANIAARLMLRCQLLIDPPGIAIEPLVGSAGFDDDSGRAITQRLSGDALRLLGYSVQTENAALNHYAEADAAMEALGLSLAQYKAAAEELAALDLVTLSRASTIPALYVQRCVL